MIKKFTQIILIPLLFSLQGCDSKKEGGAVEGINGEPIVLIGEMVEKCEGFLGSPSRIHPTSPEARSYLYRGLHIQISYEYGKSIAIVFRKAKEMGAGSRNLSESDRYLVYRLCGTRTEDLKEIFSSEGGKWETFTNFENGQNYLLSTAVKTHTMTVAPRTQATLEMIKRGLRAK